MASPAPKSVPAELAAALAAFAEKKITKVAPAAAQNVKKSKYIGKKALSGVSTRFACAAFSL